METLIALIVVAIILGAILGGKSFGDTINKGCGCLILVAVIGLVLVFIFWWISELEPNTNNTEPQSSRIESAYFEVEKECQTYTKPDIKSDPQGHLDIGKNLLVENVNKYNYFYEISNENGKIMYVRKECLTKK